MYHALSGYSELQEQESDMKERNLIEEILAYLDGQLSEEEERSLALEIQNDEDAKLLYGKLMRMHGNVPDVITELETSLAVQKVSRKLLVRDLISAVLSFPRKAMSRISDALIRGMIFLKHIIPSLKNGRIIIHNPSWWAVSIGVHALLLLIAGAIILFMPDDSVPEAMVKIDLQKVKQSEYTPRSVFGLKNSSVSVAEQRFLGDEQDTFDEEILEFRMPEDIEEEHKFESLKSSLLIKDLTGDDWFRVIRMDEFQGDVFHTRIGTSRRRAIGQYGGSQATESAVLAALRWFKRHQAGDGSWSFSDYSDQCSFRPACEPTGKYAAHGGLTDRALDNCATGFALLSFLGSGHTQNTGMFRKQVAQGISYLESHQGRDGSFAKNNYAHAISTMALAEGYGMTKSLRLKDKAQKAVNVILARQTKIGGWDYMKPNGRSDTSVTGWQIMTLKSAQLAGLDIGEAYTNVRNHLDIVTPKIKKGNKTVLAGHVAYAYVGNRISGRRDNPRLTAVGCMVRGFIGEDRNSTMLRAHGNMLLKEMPGSRKTDYYLTYYGTLAMFHLGNSYWNKWNKNLKDILIKKQAKAGCADGSWDPHEADKYGAMRAGRVFTTAMGCLSLEVYYRYPPVSVYKKIGDKK
ncbi:hypothetical protein ACFL6F_01835 [Planctomycetota bacterium]